MLGIGAFIWTWLILFSRERSFDIKLDMLHIRTVLWCFIFLSILRLLILGALFLQSPYSSICGLVIVVYIILGVLLDRFIETEDRWDREGRMTLLDIKNKYYGKDNKS